MQVELKRNASFQVVIAGHTAHFGHIEIRLAQITAEILKQVADQLLRARMVNEARLELAEHGRELFNGHLELSHLGIAWSKRLFDQLAGKVDQCRRAWPRGEGKEVALKQVLTPDFIRERRVEVDGCHAIFLCAFGSARN